METTPTHKLFTLEQLQDYQQAGKWPLADSTLLSTKYADRWEMSKRLHDTVDLDFFKKHNTRKEIDSWKDEVIPNKIYSNLHSGNVFGWDEDFMAGPNAWTSNDTNSDEVVKRSKVYFYPWSEEELTSSVPEEFSYFIEMHKDFKPVLEHYLYENYSDQSELWEDLVLYKLMIIKYNTPSATEKTRTEHRKHNSIRFGDEHCDETLAGLHLGENYSEFWAKNTKTNERDMITELADNKMLIMHGEHSEQSGWIPTYHGMQHNPQEDLGDRYSIIMDLQVRYKTDEELIKSIESVHDIY